MIFSSLYQKATTTDYLRMMKNEHGHHATNRWFAIGAFIILSYGFYNESQTRALTYLDLIAYPIGVLFCYSPVMAKDIVDSFAQMIQAISNLKMAMATGNIPVEPAGTTTTTTTQTDTQQGGV